MYFLFTPPLPVGEINQVGNFYYFLMIILVFELFYTAFSLNLTSLFPEVFMSEQERTKANNVRQIFTIIGLIFAFILPGLIISDFSDPAAKQAFREDYKDAFGFFKTIKFCFKSKSFRWYVISETSNWFVFGMLPTLVPLYAKFVLNESDAFMASLLLGLTFISATFFITFLWRPIVRKIGNRKAWMISMTIWILALFPLMIIGDLISGLIVFFLLGMGLSGSLYIIDLVVADIVDEDEVVTGMRREAGFYGVNAFVLRFSNILVILAISTVFSTVGWMTFEPSFVTPEVVLGLRVLVSVFPTIALLIAILAIYKYPLHGEKLKEVKEKLEEIHEQKKARVTR
jgi:GPH family glycoside/pentoside/hexuronide:cation symporter